MSVPWPTPRSPPGDPFAGKTLTGIPSCPDLAVQPARHSRTHVALAGPVCRHTCQIGEVLLTWNETVGHKHENRWDRQGHLKTSCASAGFPCGLPEGHFGDRQIGAKRHVCVAHSHLEPCLPRPGQDEVPCGTSYPHPRPSLISGER